MLFIHLLLFGQVVNYWYIRVKYKIMKKCINILLYCTKNSMDANMGNRYKEMNVRLYATLIWTKLAIYLLQSSIKDPSTFLVQNEKKRSWEKVPIVKYIFAT